MHNRHDPSCTRWRLPNTRLGWWFTERTVQRDRWCLPCVADRIDAARQARWNDGNYSRDCRG